MCKLLIISWTDFLLCNTSTAIIVHVHLSQPKEKEHYDSPWTLCSNQFTLLDRDNFHLESGTWLCNPWRCSKRTNLLSRTIHLILPVTKAIISSVMKLIHATRKRIQIIKYLTHWRNLAEDLPYSGCGQDDVCLFPASCRLKSRLWNIGIPLYLEGIFFEMIWNKNYSK
jgi:hypothetical protein